MRHPDVQEYQVYTLVVKKNQCINGIATFPNHLKCGYFFNVSPYHIAGHRLIIYDETPYWLVVVSVHKQ